jgi:hypothetical protein
MQGLYHFLPDRHEWVGLVIDGDTILTVGCEASSEAIVLWLEKAMEIQPWIEGNPIVPDMYDRAKEALS